MVKKFDYILDKIDNAKVSYEPFKHVKIDDLFSESDFAEIIQSPEIATIGAKSDEELFDNLRNAGYKIIEFPGCITNRNEYISWRRGERRVLHNNTACEGFGVTLRLFETSSSTIQQLNEFFSSKELNKRIAEKFDIDIDDVKFDGGIQKYLDGYEISPHPDIRRKAATFMVNINPSKVSENSKHHTHYMRFKTNWEYLSKFWEANQNVERCWVPWDWCDTV